MGRQKHKPLLAIYYSCTCCGIKFIDQKLSYSHTGCNRCGSSLSALEIREEESLKLAKMAVGCPDWKFGGRTLKGWD